MHRTPMTSNGPPGIEVVTDNRRFCLYCGRALDNNAAAIHAWSNRSAVFCWATLIMCNPELQTLFYSWSCRPLYPPLRYTYIHLTDLVISEKQVWVIHLLSLSLCRADVMDPAS